MTPQEQDLCIKYDLDFYKCYYSDHLTDEELSDCSKLSTLRWPLNRSQIGTAERIRAKIQPLVDKDIKRRIERARLEREGMSRFLDTENP